MKIEEIKMFKEEQVSLSSINPEMKKDVRTLKWT